MTVEDIEKRIQEIEAEQDDCEVAHGLEDGLMHDVLQAIADGHPDAQALAAAVLKTSDIAFPRYCA
jgi:hypothetical protein